MERFKSGLISRYSDNLYKLGTRLGGNNKPEAKKATLSLDETKIVTLAKKYIAAEESVYSKVVVDTEHRVSNLEQNILENEASCAAILGRPPDAQAFHHILAKHEHELVSACAIELRTHAELNAFVQTHELHRTANYPDDRLLHFAWLVVFVAIETGVNAFFYENASGSGLLGGAIVALGVSVVNMGAAVLFGGLSRYVNLEEEWGKGIGYVSAFSFAGIAILLNSIFCFFRDEMVDVSDDTDSLIMRRHFWTALKNTYYLITDFTLPSIGFETFLLFFIGIGCSIVAFYKGYTFDDPYPGYGYRDRKYKAATVDYKETQDNARSDVEENIRQYGEKIRELRDEILTAQRQAATLKPEVQKAQIVYAANIKEIQTELDLVIDAFRSANKAVRATPWPAYFEEKIQVRPNTDGVELITPLLEKIERLESIALDLGEKYSEPLGDLKHLLQQYGHAFLTDDFRQYLETIHQKAVEMIDHKSR